MYLRTFSIPVGILFNEYIIIIRPLLIIQK